MFILPDPIPETDYVITLNETKTFLQISDSSKDDLINALIPCVSADIMDICNRDFKDANGVIVWPQSIKPYAAKMIGYLMTTSSGSVGLQSESQGGYSYTKARVTNDSGYPDEIYGALLKWRVIRAHFANPLQKYRDRRFMSVEQIANDKSVNGQEGALF